MSWLGGRGRRAHAAGDAHRSALAQRCLAEAAIAQGAVDEARAVLQEGLALRVTLGDQRQLAVALTGVGSLAAAEGQPERALQLSGAAAPLREANGRALAVGPRTRLERAEQALGPAVTEAARRAGGAWTLEQASSEARRADQ